MFIILKHEGQLCNRIWGLLPVLSYSIRTGCKTLILFSYKNYLQYFPNLKGNIIIRFICNSNSLVGSKLQRRITRILEKIFRKYNGDLCKLNSSGLFCINGWEHRNDIAFIGEYHRELVHLFEPAPKIKEEVDKYWEDFKGITVGIHIRRGDYAQHMGGKYYFDWPVYSSVMQSISKQVVENVRFLICSNESLKLKSNLDWFQIDDTSPIKDLYALGKCDYIIGPPSSFSQWASFFGHVPLILMLTNSGNVNLSNASPIISLDHFENGSILNVCNNKNEYVLQNHK